LKESLIFSGNGNPTTFVSVIPIIALLGSILSIIIFLGPEAVSDYSSFALLSATALSVILTWLTASVSFSRLREGFTKSARQILPAVPMLIFISMVATTWMLSGVVPTLINYGLKFLNPTFFLALTCISCGAISVLTGSSWSTIATIGVAFMGIGSILGYSAAMIAGAIISGAYFGDKMSPLSDTTVVASSACGVDLFQHIRYMMITSGPAMLIALAVFSIIGMTNGSGMAASADDMITRLHETFNITPLTLIIPLITIILIILRIPTVLTLAASAMLGAAGIFIFQPEIPSRLMGELFGPGDNALALCRILWSETQLTTNHELLDSLVTTSGVTGMLPTIALILSAMLFGAAMIGTGMLASLTETFTRRLRRRTSIVGATVGSGLFLNCCTADQYLSLIIGGNMYRNVYCRFGLEPRLLSRALEDSVSVTSVLIPWNSCGVTQAAVLGVSTFAYFPYCIFNIMSPIMTMFFAWTGYKVTCLIGKTDDSMADIDNFASTKVKIQSAK
jgi:Na+/H+ antiporter